MAEDQSVDGDRWNDQANKLLLKLGWESIGDSNMDLPNEDNVKHGVDRIFKYNELRASSKQEVVLVEAKRYKTTSFTNALLETWIRTLDSKLVKLKMSTDLYEKFPALNGIPLRTGLILIWFHNINDYISYKESFKNSFATIKLQRRNVSPNKIYVLENDSIVKLASLCLAIDAINKASLVRNLQFYYYSQGGHPAKRSPILNPNFMMSKFILADYINKKNIENKVVFYFGKLTKQAFMRLQLALSQYAYLDKDKPLHIYTYLRDDGEFRKVMPDIIKLFPEKTIFNEMENLIDLPTFMRV